MSSTREKNSSGQRWRNRVPRRIIRLGVLLLVAWLICRAWFVEGLFIPLGIPSGSMAEAWLGPHCRFVCPHCGQSFCCGADVAAVGPLRVCPRCGRVAKNKTGPPPQVIAGDRALLFRSAFYWREPRRWEVVAFREPDRPSRLAIKRVVGFPGESIQIRDGDVYVDGQIARKELDEQLEMAVLVHDAIRGNSKQNAAERRWFADAADSHWTDSDGQIQHPSTAASSQVPRDDTANPSPDREGGGLSHNCRTDCGNGTNQPADKVDWLVYHHRRREGRQLVEGPVMDEVPYNQWHGRRNDELCLVADLLLRFRASQIVGGGWLIVRAAGKSNQLEAWIQPKTGTCEFRFNGQIVRQGKAPIAWPIEEMEVTFSIVDRQLILAIDGQPAIGRLLLPADRPWRASARPLAIGVDELGTRLGSLQVWRDVYYVRPTGVLARWGFDRPARLGPREYFMLGDNSPISQDSRSWPHGPSVPEKLLLGKPVVVAAP